MIRWPFDLPTPDGLGKSWFVAAREKFGQCAGRRPGRLASEGCEQCQEGNGLVEPDAG